MNVIAVCKEAQLYCDQDDLNNLDYKFVWKASLGLPFLHWIHEEEPQLSPHLFLFVVMPSSSVRFICCFIATKINEIPINACLQLTFCSINNAMVLYKELIIRLLKFGNYIVVNI